MNQDFSNSALRYFSSVNNLQQAWSGCEKGSFMMWLLWKASIQFGDPFGKASHIKLITTIYEVAGRISPQYRSENANILMRYVHGRCFNTDAEKLSKTYDMSMFSDNKVVVTGATVAYTAAAYGLVKEAMDYAIEHPYGLQINTRQGLSRMTAEIIRLRYPKAPFANLIEVSGI